MHPVPRSLHRHRHPQLHSSVDTIIVVAEYVSYEACEWRYLAKVVTPEPLLSETGA